VKILSSFTPNTNTLAPDEIGAHIGIFEARSNDGYYQLGLEAAGIIREAMVERRDLNAPQKSMAGLGMETKTETGRSGEAPPQGFGGQRQGSPPAPHPTQEESQAQQHSLISTPPPPKDLTSNPWGDDGAEEDLIKL